MTGTVASQGYTWTLATSGRVTSATTPDGVQTYAYDSNDQLTVVTSTNTTLQRQQTYYVNGNRTDSGYTVIRNRLRNDGTYSYEYDKECNRTRRTKLADNSYEAFTWDRRNRLMSVTAFTAAATNNQTHEVRYDYDGLDRRIRRTVTTFSYPGGNLTPTVVSKEHFVYDTNIKNPSFSEIVQVLNEADN